jgi:hypothetical protein
MSSHRRQSLVRGQPAYKATGYEQPGSCAVPLGQEESQAARIVITQRHPPGSTAKYQVPFLLHARHPPVTL